MEDDILEGLDTQSEDQEEEAPEAELTKEEIADLKKKAEVSSQNFERLKKAEADKKILLEEKAQLEAQLASSTNDFEDPNASVLTQLATLNQKFNQLEEDKQMDALLVQYPALKDKRSEFDAYRAEYPATKLEPIAKLFLAENELLTETPKRRGLEKAGGGQRTVNPSGKMSAEDVKRLRETNWKKYTQMLREGKIQIS